MTQQSHDPLDRHQHHLERLAVIRREGLIARPNAVVKASVLCGLEDVVEPAFKPADLRPS